MKKLLIIPIVLVLAASAAAENRLFLSAGASFLRPADEAYRTVYGNQTVYPELSAAIRLIAGVCLTGSLGRFSKNGITPDLGLETKAVQSYYSVGLSYLLQDLPHPVPRGGRRDGPHELPGGGLRPHGRRPSLRL